MKYAVINAHIVRKESLNYRKIKIDARDTVKMECIGVRREEKEKKAKSSTYVLLFKRLIYTV